MSRKEGTPLTLLTFPGGTEENYDTLQVKH
jgi:hypothetical protein